MSESRYKHIRTLKSDDNSILNLYRDQSLDRDVVVKSVPKLNGYPDPYKEVEFIKKINSKHVISIYDVINKNDSVIFVQEYLDNDILVNKIGCCTDKEFLSFAYQMVSGISDIHDHNVCHRDIKLDNMMCDNENILKIFDFGLSQDCLNQSTISGAGTLCYAAPELYEADNINPINITNAVDIYALGVTLWALKFGKIIPEVNHILVKKLNNTLNENPSDRTSAKELKYYLHRELIKGKHKGQFVYGNETYYLNQKRNITNVKMSDNFTFLTISYNGYDFFILDFYGYVFINNHLVEIGMILPEACVITFKNKNNSPTYISFSSSNPEIVI